MRSFALPALALAFTMTASFGSLLGAWAIGDEGQQKKTPIAQQRQQLMLEKQLQAMKAGHRQ